MVLGRLLRSNPNSAIPWDIPLATSRALRLHSLWFGPLAFLNRLLS